MALNKEALKQGIIVLQREMKEKTEPAEEYYAEQLSTLIENFVKSGEVIVSAGISVQTTGTQTAQTGKTTSAGKGKIT